MEHAEKDLCEAKVGGAWIGATLVEARGVYAFATKRCKVCHGQVVTKSSYTAGSRVGLQHARGHDGCPLLPARYSGMPSPHPRALV